MFVHAPRVIAVAIAAILLSTALPAGAAGRKGRVSVGVLIELRTILLGFAKQNGDAHPAQMQAVRTRSDAAEELLDGGSSASQAPVPAYLICARGVFRHPVHSVPPGYHPSGPPPTALCLVVVVRGLGLLEYSIGPRYPALHKLGPVHDLARAL